jgi:uroporphyrinogen decarboxylase
MRQAGRYLPEYRALREKSKNFLNFCKNPELACIATLQPIKRFDLDAAIIFSDILTIPDAMGLDLHFTTGEGPVFNKPIRSINDINDLKSIDPFYDLKYVMDAIKITSSELDKLPLIGFSGSPWTLATYMVEGRGSKTFNVIKKMLYQSPETINKLLNILTKNVILYLKAQIDSGVKTVMIFDTWGGILTPSYYREYSLKFMEVIVKEIKNYSSCPIILFSKNTEHSLINIAETNCNAISIDWTVNINKARQIINKKIAIQGNLDPCVLYGNKKTIELETKKILDDYGNYNGHIFNLGHGIYPDINPKHVHYMIDAIRNHSYK